MNSTRNHHFRPRQVSQPLADSRGIAPAGSVDTGYIRPGSLNARGGPVNQTVPSANIGSAADIGSGSPASQSVNHSSTTHEQQPEEQTSPRASFSFASFSVTVFLQRVLASIFGPILHLKDGINQSKIVDNRVIQKLDKWLVSLFDWTRFSRLLNGLSQRVRAIVAQRDKPLKESPEWNFASSLTENQAAAVENRPVSTTTRLGFVSFAVLFLVGGWSWFNGPSSNALDAVNLAALAEDATTQGTFAVINPANVPADVEQDAAGADQATGDEGVQPLAVISAAMTTVPTAADSGSPQLKDLLANAASGSNASINAPQNDAPSDPGPKTIAQIGVDERTANTPTITPTPTEENIPLDVPQLQLIPMLPFPSALPTETASPTPTITPTPLPIEPGSLWSTFIPGPPSEVDHFWVERPFLPSAKNQLGSPSYQFGSTAYGRYRMHHGLDMSNPIGTAVLAGVDGEVIHAGPDDPVLLAPFNNFYGNSVVIRLDRKLTIAGSDIDVFVLFGHLNSVSTRVGQRVSSQDIVGEIGMTGIAIGPHLHVEVRVGTNSYDKSVNPYLWLRPREGRGAVAVRLLTADGRSWPGGRVSLIGQGGTRFSRTIEIYLDDEPIGPDPRFGENGAMGSVPPGSYLLAGSVNGERFRKEIVVRSGETTFAEIRTQQ